MGLKSYRPPKADIPLPGGDSFAVRGVSLADVMALTETHGRTLAEMYNHFQGQEGFELDDVGAVSQSLVAVAPDLAAAIIAMASGEADATEEAAALPFPVQVEALESIGRLTFETSSPKKLLEIAIRTLQNTTGLMGDLRVSKAGSMEFGDKSAS